jgi:transposase
MDEGRFGLKVWLRRRWCPVGVRPPWVVDDRYEWVWVYGAVEPASGASVFLFLPGVDTACLQVFLDVFAREVAAGRVGLVLDGSGAHHAARLRWPDGIVPLWLPAYSPELNPAEQLFRHLRAKLANRLFTDLDELEAALTDVLGAFWDQPVLLRRLTGYPWWLQAVHSIMPTAS